MKGLAVFMSDDKAEKARTRIKTNASMINEPYSEISNKLRALYDSVQDEAIPEHFLELLENLDKAEKAANPADKGRPGEQK